MGKKTKKNMATEIAEKTGLTQLTVGRVIQEFMDAVAAELLAGRNVEFRNFGVFKVVKTSPRMGRNPKKPDQLVPIPAQYKVRFKMGKELKDKLAERMEGTE